MKLPGSPDAHLTYCLNVHPVETLADVEAAVRCDAAAVFAHVREATGYAGQCGLGLWLPAGAAVELSDADALRHFRDMLADCGFYVFTLNGFPYGRFHGERVKDAVYRPDWADPRRLDYTLRLADLLAALLPDGVPGSISTLPIAYRSCTTDETVRKSAEALRRVAAHLDRIHAETGRDIVLALEPEPDCWLDEVETVLAFFDRHLPDAALRRRIGVCLDVVHAAVLFESPLEVLTRLHAAGIRVPKMHLAAALTVDGLDRAGSDAALAPFRDEVYLHQTRVRTSGGVVALPDLPAGDEGPAGQWRVHYHLPLCWQPPPPLGSTRGEVTPELLAAARADGVTQFEVEVYTLGLLQGQPDPTATLAADLAHVWELAAGA
jgi:sugar phosphate isomerase/epimerase